MNKFQARGISKETGEFVYGYYAEIEEKHLIFTGDSFEGGGKMGKPVIYEFIEIKQEPDRFSHELDLNKNKIWEKDLLEDEYGNKFIIKFGKVGVNSKTSHTSNSLSLQPFEDKYGVRMGGQFCKKPYYKIIGNTHGI